MNHANVSAIGKTELVQLDASPDPLLELDAEALAEVWAFACDDEGADYSTLCSSRGRTRVTSDTEQ
jgi:hypothetical protein